jgi:hypothetical protein
MENYSIYRIREIVPTSKTALEFRLKKDTSKNKYPKKQKADCFERCLTEARNDLEKRKVHTLKK